jgi:hypothetical protein
MSVPQKLSPAGELAATNTAQFPKQRARIGGWQRLGELSFRQAWRYRTLRSIGHVSARCGLTDRDRTTRIGWSKENCSGKRELSQLSSACRF